MTIIAWDGEMVAADKQATQNGTTRITTKLVMMNNVVATFNGCEAAGLMLSNWYFEGANIDKWPQKIQDGEDWSELIIFEYPNVFVYQRYPQCIQIKNKFWAWGSGKDLAIGAMAAGASAIEAVKIASKYDDGCGLGIDSFNILNLIGGK